jgi:hypothetical protein
MNPEDSALPAKFQALAAAEGFLWTSLCEVAQSPDANLSERRSAVNFWKTVCGIWAYRDEVD